MNINEKKRKIKIGIHYTLRFDGDREIWIIRCLPYSDDAFIHDSATVSVPAKWDKADIFANLFVTGKRIYYYDAADHLICAGEIEN